MRSTLQAGNGVEQNKGEEAKRKSGQKSLNFVTGQKSLQPRLPGIQAGHIQGKGSRADDSQDQHAVKFLI